MMAPPKLGGESLVFEERDGGVFLVGVWRERIHVSAAVVDADDNPLVERDSGIIRIRVANGQAAYRIAEEWHDTLVCELQYAELDS